MRSVSDKRSTFSNPEGVQILQSSHVPMPPFLFPLRLVVIRLLRPVDLQSQSRSLRTATAKADLRAAVERLPRR